MSLKKGPCIRFRPVRLISDAKRRKAAELFAQNIGYRRVAALLNLSVFTVRDWGREWKKGTFKVSASKSLYEYPEDFKREVVRLRLSGLSWSQLSERTGVCPSTCRQWMKRFAPDSVTNEG